MSDDPGPDPVLGRQVPRPPAHAWRWLQRSRPVLEAVSHRLTGGPPPAGFVDDLQRAFASDAFVRAIVVDTVAEVAFGGRVPRRQPPGASWDRGLRWWGATLAGVAVEDFEARQPQAAQAGLFGSAETSTAAAPDRRGHGGDADRLQAAARRHAGGLSPQRAALARSLRELLAASDGDQVPASAVRQLIAELEDPGADEGISR